MRACNIPWCIGVPETEISERCLIHMQYPEHKRPTCSQELQRLFVEAVYLQRDAPRTASKTFRGYGR